MIVSQPRNSVIRISDQLSQKMTDRSTRFRFTEEFDLHLAREVYGQNPFEDMKRWSMIQVNMIQITGKCVSIRTLRDRIQNLLRKYSIKAASLVGKSGIEILVTEMDDLLQQILELKKEEKRKSIPLSTSTQNSKSSYMKGHDARERSCLENNATYNAEVPLGNSRKSYPTDVNVPEQLCSDPGIDLICDTEIVVEDTIEIKSNENSEANTFSSNQSTSQPITLKRKPLAQANILGPKHKRINSNIKQQTVQYLEKKNDKQYELKCRECAIQERKLKLEEQKFEMDRDERQKRLEIDERRLDMDRQERQKRLEIDERRLEMEEERLKMLFVNQQDWIKFVLNKK